MILTGGFGAEESETVEKGQVEQVFVTFVKSFFFVPSSMPPTLYLQCHHIQAPVNKNSIHTDERITVNLYPFTSNLLKG